MNSKISYRMHSLNWSKVSARTAGGLGGSTPLLNALAMMLTALNALAMMLTPLYFSHNSSTEQSSSYQRSITCRRVSATHSVKDDFGFLWERAIFRHSQNKKPLDRSFSNFSQLITSARQLKLSKNGYNRLLGGGSPYICEI
jgi:hypothetical protein